MTTDPAHTLVGKTIPSFTDPYNRKFRVELFSGPMIRVVPDSDGGWRVSAIVKAMGPVLSKTTGDPLDKRGEAYIGLANIPEHDRHTLLAKVEEDRAKRVQQYEEAMRALDLKALALTQGSLPAEVEQELIAAARGSIEERRAARQAQESQS